MLCDVKTHRAKKERLKSKPLCALINTKNTEIVTISIRVLSSRCCWEGVTAEKERF